MFDSGVFDFLYKRVPRWRKRIDQRKNNTVKSKRIKNKEAESVARPDHPSR